MVGVQRFEACKEAKLKKSQGLFSQSRKGELSAWLPA